MSGPERRRGHRRRGPRPRPQPIAHRYLRPVALTGTPGVGKSAVGRRLSRRWGVIEVSELARRAGAARRVRGGVEVDLGRLRRTLRQPAAWRGIDVVVGHLAHLLPVRAAVVLRCDPRLLLRRLSKTRRGSAADRVENFVSEALDLVLAEATAEGLTVYEVDTTDRTIADVTREVDAWLEKGGPARQGLVDWLSQPGVTAHLLDRAA